MSDQLEHTSKRLRSPSFPSLGLEDAVAKARIIWDKENRHSVPVDVAVKHWKYSPKSSGGKQALASLLKYGLLSEAGANAARTVRLTDRALQILLGEPDAAKSATKDAALTPTLNQELWNEYGKTLPSEDSLQRKLVLELKFNPSSVHDVVQTYKETLAYAGLMEETAETVVTNEPVTPAIIPPNPNFPPTPLHEKGTQEAKPNPALINNPLALKPPVNAEAMLPIPMDNGLSAYIPRGISEDDFEVLLESLKLWKRKIVTPEWPKRALWSNADNDQPVMITGPMGDKDGVRYFRSSTGTGIPEHELTFQG